METYCHIYIVFKNGAVFVTMGLSLRPDEMVFVRVCVPPPYRRALITGSDISP